MVLGAKTRAVAGNANRVPSRRFLLQVSYSRRNCKFASCAVTDTRSSNTANGRCWHQEYWHQECCGGADPTGLSLSRSL